MGTHFSPGCKNDKAHVCDCCEMEDGRPTLYWEEKDFDLCWWCLGNLYLKHVSRIDKKGEYITVKRKAITEEVRNLVLLKYSGMCVFCKSTENLQIDHIVPFSKGGNTEMDNLQVLCKNCNRIKGDK